jgi:hypothetical protein
MNLARYSQVAGDTVLRRATERAMSDGRLFGLTLFDWAVLLGGLLLSGVLTSLV